MGTAAIIIATTKEGVETGHRHVRRGRRVSEYVLTRLWRKPSRREQCRIQRSRSTATVGWIAHRIIPTRAALNDDDVAADLQQQRRSKRCAPLSALLDHNAENGFAVEVQARGKRDPRNGYWTCRFGDGGRVGHGERLRCSDLCTHGVQFTLSATPPTWC